MKRRRPARNRGFTLIELLIVIAIITTLIALTVPMIGGIVNRARISATKTTIKKAHELITKKIEAFKREYPAYHLRTRNEKYDPANWKHVMRRKTKFRDLFPQFSGGIASPANNAEALLFILTKGESFGSDAGESGNFLDAELRDTDGDKVAELIDNWGRPLRWYPWPTQLMLPQNAAARKVLMPNLPTADLDKDPDDPLGVLKAPDINEPGFVSGFHDLRTYHLPLIVSAGRDNELGLTGRLAAPNGDADALDDNITNLNNRTGND